MVDRAALGELIEYWRGRQGGAERANYQTFLNRLARALEVPEAGAATGGALGDYQFDGPIPGGSPTGGTGFADLYKRGCFILEAKQSKVPNADQADFALFDPAATAPAAPSGAKYDQLMRDALRQARRYAHNLPASHDPVPFLIVCDIGRAFELYFDFAGNGRGYGFFPDKRHYRIDLADLASETPVPGTDHTPAELLRAIWVDPASIDPRVRAADVTRDVARKLAQVSQHVEEHGRQELKKKSSLDAGQEAALIEGTSLFLMRILFCMFAEDVGLLPKDRFTEFLKSCVRPHDPDNPGDLMDEQTLRAGLVSLWTAMDSPDPAARYAFALREQVRYFNGGLFETRAYYPLYRNDLDSLIDAARHRWTNVEPAIFGTLLEQALSPADRAKLGAHYTPRPYVERLVQATITDVLAPEWAEVEDAVRAAREAGDGAGALARATEWLAYLQRQRVLDPACGTGNFLYVAMETLLRMESDAIELIASLGGAASPAIGPANFLGLELNPRAAVIAELVLWIGWLRWRTANDPAAVPDPVLRRTAAINFGFTHGYDAVLARDEAGEVARPPRQPAWPEAEFIVGNPPFIGKGAEMRRALGHDYVEALRLANANVAGGADFVMQWWDRAADLLAADGSPVRRFGFVATNSITQEFSRRVIERHLDPARANGGRQLSLVFAIPDHPWTKASRDAAAVRIAMTVSEATAAPGTLFRVTSETALDSDTPAIDFEATVGDIHADLTVGAPALDVADLLSNTGLSCNGVMLAGGGFKISATERGTLIRIDGDAAERVIRPHVGGSELLRRLLGEFVIDFFGLTEKEARQGYPATYSHVLASVKPERDGNRDEGFRNRWWIFGRPRPELRTSLSGLSRYVATTRTAKHRVFQFVTSEFLPNHEIVAIALGDPFALGVLSSRVHAVWAARAGGTLEDRPRYNKGGTFDPFPFPDPTPAQRAVIADLGEELDATRKAALGEHGRLTMTGIYNLVAKVRAGVTLTAADEVDARDGRARIVAKLHDDLDAAVAAAYGWPWPLSPGEIVTRLVTLNAERVREEAAGTVRWLRPDYQRPRFGRAGDADAG